MPCRPARRWRLRTAWTRRAARGRAAPTGARRPASTLSPAQALESSQRLGVELVAQVAARAIFVLRRPELGEERPRRELPHLLAGGAAHVAVGGDEAHLLAAAVLCRKPLEQRVRVRRVA